MYYYVNNMPYSRNNMYRNYPQNRVGGFLLPFALGFVSAPILLNSYNQPNYYQPYPYPPYPNYYPYYRTR